MSKLWICGMSGAGELENLKELFTPIIQDFDGINWVHHLPKSEESEYLESIKGNGKVIYTEYCYRNDFSRNHYLYQGTMKNGDWFVSLDTLERITKEFAAELRDLVYLLEKQGIDGAVLHGKRFLARYNDFLVHTGTPHEGLSGLSKVIELTQLEPYKDSSKYFSNVRPLKRDKYHFIDAFMKYYVSYPNSNHCLLGYEDKQEEFYRREMMRRQFRLFLQYLNIDTTVKAVKEYLLENKDSLDSNMKTFINEEKILNDFYRFHVLNDKDIDGSVYFDDKRVKI